MRFVFDSVVWPPHMAMVTRKAAAVLVVTAASAAGCGSDSTRSSEPGTGDGGSAGGSVQSSWKSCEPSEGASFGFFVGDADTVSGETIEGACTVSGVAARGSELEVSLDCVDVSTKLTLSGVPARQVPITPNLAVELVHTVRAFEGHETWLGVRRVADGALLVGIVDGTRLDATFGGDWSAPVSLAARDGLCPLVESIERLAVDVSLESESARIFDGQSRDFAAGVYRVVVGRALHHDPGVNVSHWFRVAIVRMAP